MTKAGLDIEFKPGIDQVVSRIRSLPPALIEEVISEVGEYGLTILRQEPRQKYVTRKAAYGVSFFGDKQRRWFFWALHSGRISVPYRRTHDLVEAWKFSKTDETAVFSNAAPGAGWVIGENQSRHEALVGWKKAFKVIQNELSFKSSKFRSIVAAAYQKAIKKVKIG